MPPKTGARFVVPLANQLAEEKSGMSQEGFNAIMRNFMSTMQFAATKQGEQTATSRQPGFQFRQAGGHHQEFGPHLYVTTVGTVDTIRMAVQVQPCHPTSVSG